MTKWPVQKLAQGTTQKHWQHHDATERHINVQQDRLLCPTHIDNKKKWNFLYKCVTRPDLSPFKYKTKCDTIN